MDYYMLAFSSTHAAISAQKHLTGLCTFQTMPVLREVSAGCGIALRFAPEELDNVRSTLGTSPLLCDEYCFYAVTGGGRALSAERL